MSDLRSAFLVGVGALSICLPIQAMAGPAPSLPSVECVQRLRSARLAVEAGDRSGSVGILEAAAELATCEAPALTELMERERILHLSEESRRRLRDRLAAILADPAQPLPDGTFSFVANLRDLPPETLELLKDSLVTRARGIEAPSRALLEAKADLEERLELWAEARATIDPLLGPEASEGLLWRTILLDLRLERWESALGLVERLESLAPTSPFLRRTRLQLLARLGRFEELVAALGQLQAIDEVGQGGEPVGSASLLADLGWNLRDGGHDAESEALFRKALELNPEQEEVLAVVLHLYGDPEERAAAAAARAEALAEADSDTLYRQGSSLLAAGDSEGAFPLLERAAPDLEGSELAEAAWFNLGLAAYKLERWDAAAAAFERASDLNPDRAASHYHRGLALYQLDRFAEAVTSLRRTLSLEPERHAAYYWLSHSLTAVGEDQAADEAMRRYRESEAGSGGSW